MSNNAKLNKAIKVKFDECYTQIRDIENELVHYKRHFKDKVVFCNCDDPQYSNFWKYFELNFNVLGLKKLIATHYTKGNSSYMIEISRDLNLDGIFDYRDIKTTPLKGDGDFRSEECVELLKEADIVCTNEPFSLFRPYLQQLVDHNKQFLIIGNINVISFKDAFDLIKNNKMWLGYNCVRHFILPDGSIYESARSYWYTNLDISKRHEDIVLFRTYVGNEDNYPKYLNYDAIDVARALDIPKDYDGEMGVPITFMDKYNPEQFEIIGNSLELAESIVLDGKLKVNPGRFYILENGVPKRLYDRIVIKRKQPSVKL